MTTAHTSGRTTTDGSLSAATGAAASAPSKPMSAARSRG